jgi:hypothetical protein
LQGFYENFNSSVENKIKQNKDMNSSSIDIKNPVNTESLQMADDTGDIACE